MIIGLGSQARVGKDTAASALVRDLGFRRIGFADKLKELAAETDPLITTNVGAVNVSTGAGRLKHCLHGLGGWEGLKDVYPEARTFLQNLGSAGRAVFGEDFWIDQALADITADDLVVVSDVRYRNEAEKIRSLGGKLIKIDRPSVRRTSRHPSETELEGFTFDEVIVNDGISVPDLERTVVELVSSWLPKPEPEPEPEPEAEPEPKAPAKRTTRTKAADS